VEFVGVVSDDYGVPCVISALEPDNEIIILAQDIDDLSLALVAELSACDDGEHVPDYGALGL
jgi:hypothetical protein